VVPNLYKPFLPTHIKTHRSHDILLMCEQCHEEAYKVQSKKKREVAADLGLEWVKKSSS